MASLGPSCVGEVMLSMLVVVGVREPQPQALRRGPRHAGGGACSRSDACLANRAGSAHTSGPGAGQIAGG